MAAFAACNQLDGRVQVVGADADLAGAQVVDVRSKSEVRKSPLPAAPHSVNLPLDRLRESLDKLDPLARAGVVCATGLRSYIAARILHQSGFADVANLSGGVTLRRYALGL